MLFLVVFYLVFLLMVCVFARFWSVVCLCFLSVCILCFFCNCFAVVVRLLCGYCVVGGFVFLGGFLW